MAVPEVLSVFELVTVSPRKDSLSTSGVESDNRDGGHVVVAGRSSSYDVQSELRPRALRSAAAAAAVVEDAADQSVLFALTS